MKNSILGFVMISNALYFFFDLELLVLSDCEKLCNLFIKCSEIVGSRHFVCWYRFQNRATIITTAFMFQRLKKTAEWRFGFAYCCYEVETSAELPIYLLVSI